MSPRRQHSFVLTAAIAAVCAAVGLGACGSDSDTASSTTRAAVTTAAPTTVETPATDASTTEVASTEPASTDPASTEPATSEPTTASADTEPETTTAPTEAPTTTTTPDVLSQLPGVSALEVSVGGTDATRPTFTWVPPASAASYQLVVQTAEGVPLWAWTGQDTSVVLGGAEQAADVEGPTLTGASRVRVYAFDAAFTVVAVSGWVTLPGV